MKARLRLLQDKRQILSSKAAKTTEVLLNLQEAFMQFQHELIKLQVGKEKISLRLFNDFEG